MFEDKSRLSGRVVAVPENRQLDLMASMLENRGASVMRTPMIAIHDAPDSETVLEWMRCFIDKVPDLFIILTGEGIRRLVSLAEKNDLKADFIQALAKTPKLSRGPKPVRALRELNLVCEHLAMTPTTDGVIDSLEDHVIEQKTIAVQLYGEEPNLKLLDYLRQRNAIFNTVAPYIYANKADEEKLLELIEAMANDEVDVIAFTSQPQYKRLKQVAKSRRLEHSLEKGLKSTLVAAIGPVVRAQLEADCIEVAIMPEKNFFMKPLVSAIMHEFEKS